MKRLRIAAILFWLATVAHASDCTTSKEFVLSKPQTMAGILVDPIGEPVFGWGLELLSRKGVVRKLTTDKRGAYDFGEIPAGKYHIHMTSYGFCAPKVNCHDGHCAVEPKLRLKDKGVTVE